MFIQKLRSKAGKIRDELIFGRENRRLLAAADTAKTGWITAAEVALPPLQHPENIDLEVHTLCGEGQIDMGIWSGWSLMRYLPNGRLVVHSDGTLSKASIARFKRLMPGTRIWLPDEQDAALRDRMSTYPQSLNWTQSYHFGIKLGGFHALAETEKLMDFDTDVLVLTRPTELLNCINSPECHLAWNRENRSYYAYPEIILKEILGDLYRPLPVGLNGGFMTSNRFTESDWFFMDDVISALKADPRIDHLRYWMHQTLIAIWASSLGDKAFALPSEYNVYTGPTQSTSTVRHFVGNPNTRPRFFTEGIPEAIRDARRQGQISADFFIENVPVSQRT